MIQSVDKFVPVVPISSKYKREGVAGELALCENRSNAADLLRIPKSEIDKPDANGLTHIMKAVIDNDEPAVRRLATQGANLELRVNFEVPEYSNFEGVTALGIAVILGNQNMVKLLTALGANPQGGETCPAMASFQVGEQNDDTTKLIMDIVRSRKLRSVFSQVS